MHETIATDGQAGGYLMKVKVEPTVFRELPSLRVSISTDGKNYEIINIKAVLQILKWIFRSEDIRYPPENGYLGRQKLLQAVQDVCHGLDVGVVVKKHKCRDAERDIVEFVIKPPEKNWEEWVKSRLTLQKEVEH